MPPRQALSDRRFNSRAREGRDRLEPLVRPAFETVSIHAPARGATSPASALRPVRGCFNSRAREGRDFENAMNPVIARGFNSRAREGRDADSPLETVCGTGFNSRAREGRDYRASC